MRAHSSRHRLAPALLASVLLHLVLALWLWLGEEPAASGPRAVPVRAEASAIELEIIDAPSASPPPPKAKAPATAEASRSSPRPARQRKPQAPVAQRPPAAKPPPIQEDRPVPEAAGEGAPRKLVLLPSWPGGVPGPGALAVSPPSRGRTLRPGDPALAPESSAETSERLNARVQDWMDDGAAVSRARGIGRHPYFEEMGDSLEGALARAEGGKPQQLGVRNPLAGLLKNYSAAAEQYGRTGNPGGPPPPPAPLQSEQLAARFGNETDPHVLQMRMAAQARETLEALEDRGALLTLTLELRQANSGALLDAKLLEGSGNPLFDAFVLRVAPGALGALTPPPDEALRGRELLRTQWHVEGWLRTPKELREALASLAAGQLPLPVGLLFPRPAGRPSLEPDFEYRARLLKVY